MIEAPADGYVSARRAIEALRSGVPNGDAVLALGCAQPEIEAAFRAQLGATTNGVTLETQAPGMLVSGDFGSGKSHLLEYLMLAALEQNFVCSKIVISKETPLHDPAKLYRAAIQAAVVPGKKGFALTEIATGLNFGSDGFGSLREWANGGSSGLTSYFPATLFLYERETDEEIRDRIVSFWSGDPLSWATTRTWLRDHGEAVTYKLERVLASELFAERFRFAARLMVAAGYRGWVLLVDEVELVGRYSFKQRARSYAELARWAGRLQGQACPGLATVFAITSDFSTAVLRDIHNDIEVVPGKLLASGLDPDRLLASQAERGMSIIDGRDRDVKPLRLRPPDPATIDHTQRQIREIYFRAYDWAPPQLTGGERLGTTPMRQYVRRWINEWDLKRLYDYDAHMVVEELKMDYSEDHALEVPSESETDQGTPD